MNLELVRFSYAPDVTLGQLFVGDLELFTLEEPWRENHNGPGGTRKKDGAESCVPDGDYILKPHNGTRFKRVWRLSNYDLGVYDFEEEIPDKDSWGRATVLIHNGNTTDHIIGCILVGMIPGHLDGKPAVLRSTEALDNLRNLLGPTQLHSLSIRPTLGTQ